MRLNGRVAVVSGGGVGIGAATCRALAAEGAAVVVSDADETAAHGVAKELERAAVVVGDPACSSVADAAVRCAVEEYGGLDVLAAFALPEPGTQSPAGRVDELLALTDEQWRRAHAAHTDAGFYFARAALRIMVPRGAGAIVTLASMAGLSGQAGEAGLSASSAALLGLTRALAADVSPLNIRVNAIAAGPVAGVGVDGGSPRSPSGRQASPEEIAEVAVFLASDEASFIFGETVSANGGLLTI